MQTVEWDVQTGDEEAWHLFLTRVRERNIPASVILREAKMFDVRKGWLRVFFPYGMDYHAEALGSPRCYSTLQQVVVELTGGWIDNLEFIVSSVPPAKPPVVRRRSDYEVYLQSDHWKHVREIVKEHYGASCSLCGGRQRLNVHHRTYERLGKERLSDLTVLCRGCHAKHHDKLA